MKRVGLIALAAAIFAAPAAAETLPSRLADRVGNDPKASTPECRAAQADAREWSEGGARKVLKGVGRVAIWPLGESSAHRRSDEVNAARERVMERLRQACFTQPAFIRAHPSPDQRWPGGKGYSKKALFRVKAGGREVVAMIHPTANTILLRTGEDGPGHTLWTSDGWVGPLAWSLEPTGCRVTEDHAAPSYGREVGFVCSEGVDLRAIVRPGQLLR